jgi:hypothetical protein
MEDYFRVDHSLLDKARVALQSRKELYWITGGSCTGKSTVAAAIADRTELRVVDMDAYIYDRFMPAYQTDRHPASKAWFGSENPLAWVLSLGWEEFNALNRATNAEFLDLLVDELDGKTEEFGLLVDGGFTHPSLLAEVVPASRIVCLETADAIRSSTWETAEERSLMKQWVHDLPDGEAKWRKFLFFDKMVAETLSDESKAAGVEVIGWDEGVGLRELSDMVMIALEL